MDRKNRKRDRAAGRGRPTGRPGASGRGREGRGRDRSRPRDATRDADREAEVGQIRFGRRNATLFLVAAGVILTGFIVLALGDTILAPILLVGGYLVLVPWAIMARSGPASAQVAGTAADPAPGGGEGAAVQPEFGSDQGGG